MSSKQALRCCFSLGLLASLRLRTRDTASFGLTPLVPIPQSLLSLDATASPRRSHRRCTSVARNVFEEHQHRKLARPCMLEFFLHHEPARRRFPTSSRAEDKEKNIAAVNGIEAGIPG